MVMTNYDLLRDGADQALGWLRFACRLSDGFTVAAAPNGEFYAPQNSDERAESIANAVRRATLCLGSALSQFGMRDSA